MTLGVEEAARQLGFGVDVRLAADVDRAVAATYADNFRVPGQRIAGGVETCFDRRHGRALSATERATAALVGRHLELLVGGPPCQGHSPLNNHTRGDDPTNALYLAMVRAVEVLGPQAVLIENVPAIERDRSGVVYRARVALTKLEYNVVTRVISIADIGVPQLRKRHVLLAHASRAPSIEIALLQARFEKPRDLRWAIRDLKGKHRSALDDTPVLAKENLRRARHLLKHGLYDLPNR